MDTRIIKIEFKERIDLDLNNQNQMVFKTKLVNKIKEILNAADIEDFHVYDSADIQEVILQIDNTKSGH
ncbi:hypothetical protein QLS91_16095 [Flavobacterium sp. LB2P84]|uniref:hypothetical protein n=1 Tax=Flavobacterium yafengii TaxID=3041253 RepID=UPI0024A9CC01|nr:hypothetical protein [Flavobacterium yafengii]MDI6034602.1 hypothetical protein [Flavobacterium yafengii]